MHMTAAGDQMYIAEMDNDHLKNTINSIFRNLDIAKKALNQDSSSSVSSVLYKSRTMTKDKAKFLIESMVDQQLPHYLMEASLRGMEFSKELKEFFDRDSQLAINGTLILCPHLDDE